jgi:hypothetical protein
MANAPSGDDYRELPTKSGKSPGKPGCQLLGGSYFTSPQALSLGFD